MCNPQGHLTIEEREKIRCGREKGITLTEIARMLGRHKSTISREVRRNRLGRNPYQAHTAQQLYQQRRKACVRMDCYPSREQ
jgi:IS30 family transposase